MCLGLRLTRTYLLLLLLPHAGDRSTAGSENASSTDPAALAALIRDTGADGFNGDCMGHIDRQYLQASLDAGFRPIAMEAEGGLGHFSPSQGYNGSDINYDTLGWAEGYLARDPLAVSGAPDVDKSKWLSNGKAMSSWSDRYSGSPVAADQYDSKMCNSKIPALQVQWFNGLGFQTWENIWGVWNGITPRDGEAIRRVALMQRFFGNVSSPASGFLQSRFWVPHSTQVPRAWRERGIFASAFPSPTSASDEVLFALVNRAPKSTGTAGAALLNVSKNLAQNTSALHFYDCYRGVELYPSTAGMLRFDIESHGFGCIFASNSVGAAPGGAQGLTLGDRYRGDLPVRPQALPELLRVMVALTARNLSSFSPAFVYAQQVMLNGTGTNTSYAASSGAGQRGPPVTAGAALEHRR